MRCYVRRKMGFGLFLGLIVSQIAASQNEVVWKHLSNQTGDFAKAEVGRQVAALIFDIDRNGVNDFVIASYEKMVWFRHEAQGWTRFPIENGDPTVRMEAGGDSLDIDEDGDLDLIMGAQSKKGEIWWWENPFPNFSPETPWKRHLAIEAEGTHHDQIFGDFDGDGKNELAFWFNGGKRLYLAEIPDDPTQPWPHSVIAQLDPKGANPEGLGKIDMNGDGILDIVGGGAWFEFKEGKYETHIADLEYRFTRSAVGDLIEGGRPEIVIGSGDGVGPLNVYEWKEGKWNKKTVIDHLDHGHTLQVGDLNSDGHLDIYTAEMYNPGSKEKCRQFVLYGDGQGNFKRQLLSTGIGTHEGKIGDLDGDGDLDILEKDFQQNQRVDIWLNQSK